jgi:opacity protein-like surface antigen
VSHYPLAVWRALPATIAAATLFVALPAQPARADDGGLYLGANLGYTLDTYRHADLNSALIEQFASAGDHLTLSSSSLRDARDPWSVDLGYRFSSYFGVEASYLQLGTLEYGARGKETGFLGSSTPLATSINIKSRGPAVALVGMLPMTYDWNLDARLGVYEGKTLSQYVTASNAGGFRGSDSTTSATLLASVGTSYVVGGHWMLCLDYIRLNQIGEKLVSKSFNVDLLTAGVTYTF